VYVLPNPGGKTGEETAYNGRGSSQVTGIITRRYRRSSAQGCAGRLVRVGSGRAGCAGPSVPALQVGGAAAPPARSQQPGPTRLLLPARDHVGFPVRIKSYVPITNMSSMLTSGANWKVYKRVPTPRPERPLRTAPHGHMRRLHFSYTPKRFRRACVRERSGRNYMGGGFWEVLFFYLKQTIAQIKGATGEPKFTL